jgi:ABC-type multidrug transport system fused ATPase/permease subunit
MGGAMGILSYFASGNLYNDALRNLFHAPMHVFDTTPLGRIMGVFGKDVSVGRSMALALDG